MGNITLIHSTSPQREVAFLVQKLNGFLQNEDRLLFFFEHKTSGYESGVLEKQMNRQLFYMEEMWKKQITKN